MASRRTYYMVLGISEGDSPATVRAAFRDLAQRYHPDRAGPAATPFFQEIVEAYETLSDPERRAAYDRGLRHLRNCSDGHRVRVSRPPREGVEPLVPDRPRRAGRRSLEVPVEELGVQMRRSWRTGRADARVRPVYATLRLSEGDALRGGLFELEMPVFSPCPVCRGRGVMGLAPCPGCGGDGLALSWAPTRLLLPPGLATGDVVAVATRGFGLHGMELRLRVVVTSGSRAAG